MHDGVTVGFSKANLFYRSGRATAAAAGRVPLREQSNRGLHQVSDYFFLVFFADSASLSTKLRSRSEGETRMLLLWNYCFGVVFLLLLFFCFFLALALHNHVPLFVRCLFGVYAKHQSVEGCFFAAFF